VRVERIIVALVAGITLACSADDASSPSGGGNTGDGTGGGSSSNPPSNPQPSAGCGTPAAQTGTFASTISVVTQQDGTQVRDYWTVVPADYDGSRPLALIFNWHGLGNDAQQTISWLGVVAEAGNEAIHVFPQALSGGWGILEREPDVPLYDALLAQMLATYCIDTNRVYGIGHSNGAYLNEALACLRTETLRAIANVSGLWNTVPNNECVPMNYMLLTGEQDTTVNTTNAETTLLTFTTGCSETGTPVTDPAVGGTCTDYTDCPPGSSVRWCTHPGGHDWPQPFANQAIWTFLQRVW
jgi:hypothetical protein